MRIRSNLIFKQQLLNVSQIFKHNRGPALSLSKGFSLLETIVAIAIIMIAIGGAFGLAPEGLNGARFARNQTVATYLAQEGIEVVRSIRDDNMLFQPNPEDPRNWLRGMTDCIDSKCTVNTVTSSLHECIGSCDPVRFLLDPREGGVYGNGGDFDRDFDTEDTIFTREVSIEELSNIAGPNVEALITVVVYWNEGSIEKRTEIKTSLFDWWTLNK